MEHSIGRAGSASAFTDPIFGLCAVGAPAIGGAAVGKAIGVLERPTFLARVRSDSKSLPVAEAAVATSMIEIPFVRDTWNVVFETWAFQYRMSRDNAHLLAG